MTPTEKFRTIVIDPPWPGPGHCPTFDNHRGLCLIPYHTMTGIQVASLRVPDIAADDAQLFIWSTTRSLGDAYLLVQTWAFRYRGLFIWQKPLGLGRNMRHEAEFLLWAARTGAPWTGPKDCPRQIQAWPKPKRHSEKPAEAFDFISRLSLPPRIEIFARLPHEGFTPWGDEAQPVPAA